MTDDEVTRTVTDAVLELCCREGTLKERLSAATQTFDRILLLLHRQDRWPNPLLQRAEEIDVDLHSQIACWRTTADCHEAGAARRLAERLLQLYADVQQACHSANNYGARLQS